MAVTAISTNAGNAVISSYLFSGTPGSGPLRAIPITKIEVGTTITTYTPKASDTTLPTGPNYITIPVNGAFIYHSGTQAVLTVNDDRIDPSTGAQYSNINVIGIYITPTGGNETLACIISENDLTTQLFSKLRTAELEWSVTYEVSSTGITAITYTGPPTISFASLTEAITGTNQNKIISPYTNKEAFDAWEYPTTFATFNSANRDMNGFTTPGRYALDFSGNLAWQNTPSGAANDQPLLLTILQYGNANELVQTLNAHNTTTGQPGAEYKRFSYEVSGSLTWGSWVELGDVNTATNAQAKAALTADPASNIENNVLTLDNLYYIRNLLGSRGGGAMNYDLVLQTTTNTPWDGGNDATLQSLTRPHSGQWLNNTNAELKAYNALVGCSLVKGGIHFDWTDTAVASVDAMFAVSGGGSDGLATVSGASIARNVAADFSINRGTDTGSFFAAGLAVYNGIAYITDQRTGGTAKVYANRLDGTRVTTEEWNLGANTNPRGMTIHNGKAYIVGSVSGAQKVLVYRMSDKVLLSTEGWNLNASNGNPNAIAIFGGKAYITDNADNRIYIYQVSNGNYLSSEGFGLASGQSTANGIYIRHSRVYTAFSGSTDKVFVYGLDGTHLSNYDWNLATDNSSPSAMDEYQGLTYVLDSTQNKVFAYSTGIAPRFGIVKTSGGIGIDALDVLSLNDYMAPQMRSPVITITRNDYLLFAADVVLTPFRVLMTVLKSN